MCGEGRTRESQRINSEPFEPDWIDDILKCSIDEFLTGA